MRSVFYFLLPTFYFLVAGNALAQSAESSPSRFNGTWKREDSDDTVTIYVAGDAAFLTSSGGGHGSGIFNGDTIVYSGSVNADEGLVKTFGTFEVTDDGNTLIKRREIYFAAGTKEETVKYTRVASDSADAPTSPPQVSTARSTPVPNTIATPTPTPKPSLPFIGTWRAADESAKLTITVSGRNAALKYSPGSRETGTIRGSKIECEPESDDAGIKNTDVFEMSPNGRTLIRHRTLQSPRGEVAHETLTYSRTE